MEKSFKKGLELILKNKQKVLETLNATYLDFEDLIFEQDNYPISYIVKNNFEIIGVTTKEVENSFYTCYIIASKKDVEDWKLKIGENYMINYGEQYDFTLFCDHCNEDIEVGDKIKFRVVFSDINCLCQDCIPEAIHNNYFDIIIKEHIERFGYNTYDEENLKLYIDHDSFFKEDNIDIKKWKENTWHTYDYYERPNRTIFPDGSINFTIGYNIPHNFYGPAIDEGNGTKKWYINGKLHRYDDLPAIEYSDGKKVWYCRGVLHRNNDKPASVSNYSKEWFFMGRPHRGDNKPAIEYNDGGKVFMIDGKFHNLYEPAWQTNKTEYWIDGVKIEKNIFEFIKKKRIEKTRKYWFIWMEWMMDINTERGKRYLERSLLRDGIKFIDE